MKIKDVTAESREMVSMQICCFEEMTRDLTKSECEADPWIVAAREDLRETMRTFIKKACEVGSLPRPDFRTEEEENALRVAYDIFDSFCAEMQLAEAMQVTPGNFMEDFETEEDVVAAGKDLAVYCWSQLLVARRLWEISILGLESAI